MAGERRLYQRISTELPLELHTDDGESARAIIRNLSVGGLEISCDRWCADRILPSGHQAFPGQPISARLRWQLAGGDGADHAVEATGEIVVSRRLSQNEYRVGIHILGFKDDGERLVDQYVRARAR